MRCLVISLTSILVFNMLTSCKDKEPKENIIPENTMSIKYKEPYRPQFHFSPEEKWMNDPNGLVYNEGVYHLFYQYYPEDIVWGPMHWGHAISKDLIHWKQKPIALFPDENGYIFSGSAVVDSNNTSSFGSKENLPLVAIYTYHDMEGEKAGREDYQTQGIAYSLDNGETWKKYEGNPVIANDGIKDFRDPKVFWNDITSKWSMLLVAGDHLQIWSSDNLREWKKDSDFGKNQGAHGGVWECPDMFELQVEGSDQKKWVLLISINPGAPNGGSGTQYFIGDFNGKTFTSDQREPKWIDWGTDNYAGVTYNNMPSEDRIFIGWMSNWTYARDTPTEKWRSAMTVPRKLSLRKIGNSVDLINYPIAELHSIAEEKVSKAIKLQANSEEVIEFKNFNQTEIQFTTASRNFELVFENERTEQLILQLDGENQVFQLDRSKSGKTSFQEDFGKGVQRMPIPNLPDGEIEIRILMDWSSVEVFVNGGQYVMTSQIFPNANYTMLGIKNPSDQELEFKKFKISAIQSTWEE